MSPHPTDLSVPDPLSDIVGMLQPHDCVAAGLDAGGDWAIRFGRHAGIKCNAVVKGGCELVIDGLKAPAANERGCRRGTPIRLDAGDCFLLPHGRPFLISAEGARLGEDAETVYAPVRHGGTAVHGGGGDFFMTGARFLVSGPAASVLLDAMPPVLVVRQGARSEAVGQTLKRIVSELREANAGHALVIAHLSHLLLIEVMRQHLAEAPSEAAGWTAALADPALALAIAAIHAEPARPWTVEALAERAAMSRTTFAIRFRRVVGQTPIAYLTRWRMLRAADRLSRTGDSVARIAAGAGYGSESAFAQAFRREIGHSPRRYARERPDGSATPDP